MYKEMQYIGGMSASLDGEDVVVAIPYDTSATSTRCVVERISGSFELLWSVEITIPFQVGRLHVFTGHSSLVTVLAVSTHNEKKEYLYTVCLIRPSLMKVCAELVKMWKSASFYTPKCYSVDPCEKISIIVSNKSTTKLLSIDTQKEVITTFPLLNSTTIMGTVDRVTGAACLDTETLLN